MTVQVIGADLHILNMRTRMPFKYGIAELTALPHLFVRLAVQVGSNPSVGIASDGLAPKWFTKNPDTDFVHDIEEMIEVVKAAVHHATDVCEADTCFDLWERVYTAQSDWAASRNHPPLLWAFGVSLVERALIDAYCKAANAPFAKVVRNGQLGMDPSRIHRTLSHSTMEGAIPAQLPDQLAIRHTVGLADPLRDSQIPENERLDDGLPQSLASCVKQYQLRYFKIKLCGDLDVDRPRLCEIAAILDTLQEDYHFTLDGNEQYKSVEAFGSAWESLRSEPRLTRFFKGLLFVEQPIHRDVALSSNVTTALKSWPDRPPMSSPRRVGRRETRAAD